MIQTPSLSIVERVTALHRVDLFSRTPGRVLAAVAAAAEEHAMEAGDVLIEQGAVENHMFVLVDGRVRVHRGETTLVELGPGHTVGELAVLVPEPRAASVTALERVHALRLEKEVLDDFLADWPELAEGVIASLVTRLRLAAEHADVAPHQ